MSTSRWYEEKKMADYEAEWQAAKRALPIATNSTKVDHLVVPIHPA